MSWVKAMVESELKEGEKKVVKLGEQSVLLLRHQGAVYATTPKCPHMGGPLERGRLQNGAIICPLHHSAFDLRTGDVKEWTPWPPAVGKMLGAIRRERALKTYLVKVESGSIWVDVES